ncbi:Dipeptidyl aminopeptidase/acylaminoacyl peptidase [Flavobacteriaceae bacterium MAR_2010_188]|nr:Dipeptidyl aminopeptidase/acylaminoacyl peptidase [Flavobacteriaceae bacterium MAR_2010_188]
MIKNYLLLVICLGLFCCKEEKPKDNAKEDTAQNVNQYTIEQFMDNESINGATLSPDKSKVLVSSNRTGIYNLYTIPVTGGELTPVTSSDSSSIWADSYFPNDNRMLFNMDGHGDENDHLFVIDSTGSITDLTPWKGSKSSFYGWADDGKSFYLGTNKRDPQFFDVYKMSTDGYKPTLLYQNNDNLTFTGMSDDENYLALSKSMSTNDSDLYVYNRKTKEKVKVNDSLSANSSQAFNKENSKLYYTTDVEGEYAQLMSYDLETKKKELVLSKDWDISGMDFSRKGTYMTIFINEDGKNKVEIYDVAKNSLIDLPSFDDAEIISASFSNDESMMILNVGGSNSPTDLYSYNLENKELIKLTSVLNKEIKSEDLVSSKVIRFKSFDGTEIPAIYYLPKQASANSKVPGLIFVHGGPGGQTRQGFSSVIQYLVNHGYAVLAVNNRGSSGYGKTFYQMDDKNHGEKDLQDCIEGKNWLATQPEVDGEKIGIMGGSYGGYMTMAALTYAPEEFDVGVNLFGVTNWLRTLKSIPPYWESFRTSLYKELGDPYSADSVRLRKISPLFHTDKVTKPLIVLQGSQDPRVLQVESDEIVAGVKANGVPVEYVLFEDEGHGFVKKENQIEAYSRILNFLDIYLKKSKQPIDGEMQDTKIEAEKKE